jgi:hypothetical protein
MFQNLKRGGIVAALAVGAMTLTTTPAEARDGYRGRGDDTAAIAVGAGIIGLAVGAAIASSDRGYYGGYYGPRGYYGRPYYPAYPRGYYYDRYPRPYYRDYRGWDRGHDHGNHRGWDRGRHRGW